MGSSDKRHIFTCPRSQCAVARLLLLNTSILASAALVGCVPNAVFGQVGSDDPASRAGEQSSGGGGISLPTLPWSHDPFDTSWRDEGPQWLRLPQLPLPNPHRPADVGTGAIFAPNPVGPLQALQPAVAYWRSLIDPTPLGPPQPLLHNGVLQASQERVLSDEPVPPFTGSIRGEDATSREQPSPVILRRRY